MPRARHTCTECSLRRQKCDRKTPCDRCVKRGIPDKCSLEWSMPYDPQQHRVYPRRQSASIPTPDRDSPGSHHVSDQSNHHIQRQSATSNRRQTGSNSPSIAPHDGPSNSALDPSYADEQSRADDPLEDRGENDATLSPGIIASAPVNTNITHEQDWSVADQSRSSNAAPSPVWNPQEGFPNTNATPLSILHLQLPGVEQIWHLVDYHERSLLWYHGCYHGPTFRFQLQQNLHAQEDTLQLDGLDLQWVALLFSIMAGSISCAPERVSRSWGFWKTETSKLSRQWYKATIQCLNLAEYTCNHSILSVHAITTLSMSAHTLGLSEDHSVLLGASLRIARSLGLDRLKRAPALDTIDEQSSTEQRQQVLRREIGRRLWSQLCVQDWFSVPFFEAQCVGLSDFRSPKPSNRDHITMASLPESCPTYVSYGNYVNDIAKLMAEHHIAMVQSSTPFTKYEKVLEYDTRMKDLARNQMPAYFHVTTPLDFSWPSFIPWARRSLTICFAHKVIMIHRAFIRQSFTNPAFQLTRVTCVAASKTILKEVKLETEQNGPIIWIDQAFCVAAGIVLCLDIFHRVETDLEFKLHVDLVTDCIDMLKKLQGSAIADRGVRLLTLLLSERKKLQHPLHSRKRGHPSTDQAGLPHTDRNRRVLDLTAFYESLRYDKHTENRRTLHATYNDLNDVESPDIDFRRIAEVFPPPAGFSNSFLFGNLLNLRSMDT